MNYLPFLHPLSYGVLVLQFLSFYGVQKAEPQHPCSSGDPTQPCLCMGLFIGVALQAGWCLLIALQLPGQGLGSGHGAARGGLLSAGPAALGGCQTAVIGLS